MPLLLLPVVAAATSIPAVTAVTSVAAAPAIPAASTAAIWRAATAGSATPCAQRLRERRRIPFEGASSRGLVDGVVSDGLGLRRADLVWTSHHCMEERDLMVSSRVPPDHHYATAPTPCRCRRY